MFFFIMAMAAGLAIALAFAMLIFYVVYTAPFYLWVGFQNNAGKYRELGKYGCFRTIRNATSLYISWISHKTPVFH